MHSSTEEIPAITDDAGAGAVDAEGQQQPSASATETSESLSRTLDPRRAIVLLAELGLTDADIATAVGVTDRSVRRWRGGEDGRSSLRYWKQVDDLRAIVALLQDEGTLPDGNIVHWLRARNRRLEDRRPLDLLEEGRFDAVRDAALTLVDA